jgi:DNA-binding transcriptional LysR family regulator
MVQNIRTIGLPALLSFRTVARLGGITAAAAHLGMAKSGVSRHVTQLEAHLGVRLLERGARSVNLTPIGWRLDQRVLSILAEVDLLNDIAREESVDISGQVTVATTPEIGGFVASNLFPALQLRHPNLKLVVRPQYAFEDMRDPDTDIAFRVGTFKDDRLVARELGAFRFYVVAAPAIAEKFNIARPGDLVGMPCLTFRRDLPRSTWTLHSETGDAAVEVTGPIAVRSYSILYEMVVAGQGFGFLPAFMVRAAISNGTLARCLPDYVSRPYSVFLTYRPGARRIARVEATARLAEELVPEFLSEPTARE